MRRYADAMLRMDAAHAAVLEAAKAGVCRAQLLVTEHTPVVTMGNRELTQDLQAGAESLARLGIDYAKTDRGGSVTVHEPGQLVVYPIVPLRGFGLGVRAFVHLLEEAMIRACAACDVVAARDPINPGVWVGAKKIGAIGIRVDRGVTRHGLALNVENSLATFAHVIPCGIHGRGITSLASECAETRTPAMAKVTGTLVGALQMLLSEAALGAATPMP